MTRTRSAKASVLVLAGALLVSRAHAAPPKKQCIAAAEQGQQLRSEGHLRDARRTLAACTQNSCPTIVRRDCGRWIDEIDATQPSVTVRLEEDGVEVPDGKVFLDGDPLLRGDGRSTPLDPGTHRFLWSRDGGNVEQEITIREGEHNRLIVLRPGPGSAKSQRFDEGPPPDRSRSGASPLPWIVGGTGLALAAGGAILWGIGLTDRSNLASSCAAAHACAMSDVEASHVKLEVGDVLFGVGLVAVATAVVLLLLQDPAAPPRSAILR